MNASSLDGECKDVSYSLWLFVNYEELDKDGGKSKSPCVTLYIRGA